MGRSSQFAGAPTAVELRYNSRPAALGSVDSGSI